MSGHAMSFESALGERLMFHSMRARMALGRLPEYDVTLLSPDAGIPLPSLLGERVAVRLLQPDGHRRTFSGLVVRFRQTGMRGRYVVYQAEVRPWLWLLTRRTNCRIFQERSVRQIVDQILDDPIYAKLRQGEPQWHLDDARHKTRDYCVQYRESDFAFISRLLEEEGIYYWFGQEADDEQLLLTDNFTTHLPVPGHAQLRFQPAGAEAGEQRISRWQEECGITPPRVVSTDYNFKSPSADMLLTTTVDTQGEARDTLEHFEFPGGYDDQFDDEAGADPRERGKALLESRAWEAHEGTFRIQGEANVAALRVGATFRRHDQVRSEIEYLVTSAEYELDYADYEGLEQSNPSRYLCRFEARYVQSQFVPERRTPRPRVQGPQTAVVTGPAGKEIHTDRHGRVQVHFFWDRYSTRDDEDTSCWMRVSQPWAGKNWGMIALPRVGQEVIVDFLEGDPDRPIITGRVYNAEQGVPYKLEENQTQTGIRTRSTPGGTDKNYNELKFDDAIGKELFSMHAERNMSTSVENDSSLSVGHDRSVKVSNNRTTHIQHDDTLTLEKGNRTVVLEAGDHKRTVTGQAHDYVTQGATSFIGQFHMQTVQGLATTRVTGARVDWSGSTATVAEQAMHTETKTGGMSLLAGAGLAAQAVGDASVSAGGMMLLTAQGPIQAQADSFLFNSAGDAVFQVNNFTRIMQGKATDVALGTQSVLKMSSTEEIALSLENKVSAGLSNSVSLSGKIGLDLGVSMVTKAVADLDTDLIKLFKAALSDSKAGLTNLGGGGGGGGGGPPGAPAAGPAQAISKGLSLQQMGLAALKMAAARGAVLGAQHAMGELAAQTGAPPAALMMQALSSGQPDPAAYAEMAEWLARVNPADPVAQPVAAPPAVESMAMPDMPAVSGEPGAQGAAGGPGTAAPGQGG